MNFSSSIFVSYSSYSCLFLYSKKRRNSVEIYDFLAYNTRISYANLIFSSILSSVVYLTTFKSSWNFTDDTQRIENVSNLRIFFYCSHMIFLRIQTYLFIKKILSIFFLFIREREKKLKQDQNRNYFHKFLRLVN